VIIIDRLKNVLTKITIDDIWKSCTSGISYINLAVCRPHETICDATVCVYERYIYDGCNQKSNTVYESVLVLPRAPFFVEFPGNINVACNEDVDLKTASIDRFKHPIVNPGCRGALALLSYTDTKDNTKCAEKIYRKFRVEIDGCENELFNVRTQQLYVEDKQAPQFTTFPKDKHVEFLSPMAHATHNGHSHLTHVVTGHLASLTMIRLALINERVSVESNECGASRIHAEIDVRELKIF
jgi:hypothetical protein